MLQRSRSCAIQNAKEVEQIGKEIEQALVKLKSPDATSYIHHKVLLNDLNVSLKKIAPLVLLESSQKELNGALGKCIKQLEKAFTPDISKACRNVNFDSHTVNQIIASHLYREGEFDAGDLFASETGGPEVTAMKSCFIEMYQYHILQAMESHDLGPALKWTATNIEKLQQGGSDLEVKLHTLQYLEILQQSREDALNYARIFLSPFASSHFGEIQKLMACLLWAGKLYSSPFLNLLFPENWEKLAEEFVRQFLNLLGQSFESPLSVTVAAGIQGLPTLLKMMNVMMGKKQEWQSIKQLPVPVDLGKKFQFHTILVCPVSRDQATEENPPMLMSCGHVLCSL